MSSFHLWRHRWPAPVNQAVLSQTWSYKDSSSSSSGKLLCINKNTFVQCMSPVWTTISANGNRWHHFTQEKFWHILNDIFKQKYYSIWNIFLNSTKMSKLSVKCSRVLSHILFLLHCLSMWYYIIMQHILYGNRLQKVSHYFVRSGWVDS